MEFIKSPLNYTGGKYKLLPQITKLFPKTDEYETFIDIFCGGLNVAININSKKIIANDYNNKIIELYEYFSKNKYEYIESLIYELIKKYKLSDTSKNGYEYYDCNSSNGLGNYNKEGYLKLREDYNKEPNSVKFFLLIIYCFNHQIRFNNKGLFNLPVGKRDFNNSIKSNLENFINKLSQINIKLYSKDYKKVFIPKNSFIYLDPPYLASTASYNENGGWNENKEIELLNFIDSINTRNLNNENIKIALSNVIQNKNKKNQILVDWVQKNKNKYNIHYLNYSYSNSNYQSKNREIKTVEVLITNY